MDFDTSILIDTDADFGGLGSDWAESGPWAKKCGVEIGDPNLRFQPRLPGSVVGKVSMGQAGNCDKITEVTVRW
jgi:hypothetical protein